MPTPRRLLVYYVAGLAIILAMVVWTYVKQDIDSDVDLAAWRHANMAIAPAEVDPKAYFAQSESAFKLFVGCLCLLIVYLTVGVTVSITLALGAKDRRPTGRSEFP